MDVAAEAMMMTTATPAAAVTRVTKPRGARAKLPKPLKGSGKMRGVRGATKPKGRKSTKNDSCSSSESSTTTTCSDDSDSDSGDDTTNNEDDDDDGSGSTTSAASDDDDSVTPEETQGIAA